MVVVDFLRSSVFGDGDTIPLLGKMPSISHSVRGARGL